MPQTHKSHIRALEQKIDDLISLCAELSRENVALKTAAEARDKEWAALLASREAARRKVEAVIAHLRKMEASS